MNIKVKGICIGHKPKRNGLYQGYIIADGKRYLYYGKTREALTKKIYDELENGFEKGLEDVRIRKKVVNKITTPPDGNDSSFATILVSSLILITQ